jgi:hypothetical protein
MGIAAALGQSRPVACPVSHLACRASAKAACTLGAASLRAIAHASLR